MGFNQKLAKHVPIKDIFHHLKPANLQPLGMMTTVKLIHKVDDSVEI